MFAPAPGPPSDSTRANATVGVALLLALTVVTAGSVGAVLVDRAASTVGEPAPTVALSLSVEGDRLTVTHEGGAALDTRRLRLVVTVDGEPLAHQPPVPFFSARGFAPGPTGPFNVAADQGLTAGESAGFVVAGTNSPALEPGSTVEVAIYREGTPVATLTATV
ncbi:type IV pilin [Halobium salinum]|uniref:Type IV pilin n=1 Tax=Halobium salinum TaxID=1364940 RepID=A0ABD5PF81_9EURY|nr:type IV pilin [Halobium salinum]